MRAVRIILFCLLTFSGLANAQTDLRIKDIHANEDCSVTITWSAVPTWTYHVMSADEVDGSWQDFPDGSLTASTNDLTLSYTDTNAAAISQRFYKIRKDPAQLVMTLVLDRSGSMNGNGGSTVLRPAVTAFISLFDDTKNRVAMVSFASAARVDVPMGQPFKDAITNALGNLVFTGGTFAQGGLTNALVQNNSVVFPPGQNVLKVAVFFTDGLANIIQDTLNCPPLTVLNFGGYDSGGTVGFFNPTNGNQLCTTSGGAPACCSGTTQFRSAFDGTMKSFTRTNVSTDAEYRTIQVADDMRAQGMYIYVIGLGNNVSQTFLQMVANDPNSPWFDPAQPVGKAVFAPTATDLLAVFQEIASKILSY